MMNFLYGELTEPPKDFSPPETWPEYGLLAEPLGFCARESVGSAPMGVRWSAWPLTFEEYVSDREPDVEESKKGTLARNRWVTWKRISRADIPPGWRIGPKKPWRIDGFHTLSSGDYTGIWHKNARREARLWRERHLDVTHRIEQASFEEFKRAYLMSSTLKKTGMDMLSILERKYALGAREYIELWVVRDIKHTLIVAGTAIINSPSTKSSVRFCPFMLPAARETFASTGLVDYWFELSQQRGVRYQVFTCFWQPGDPKGWKGPAEFKSHFGLKYVAYPPLLYRFVRGKVF